MIRRFFMGLAAALGIVTLGLLFASLALQNRGTQERLRHFVESIASDALDANVTIAELTLTLMPPASLELRGVEIAHPDPTVYTLSVDNVAITLRPVPSTSGKWVRTDVRVHGVRVSGDTLQWQHQMHTVRRNPAHKPSSPLAWQNNLPLYLNTLALEDLNVSVGLDNGDMITLTRAALALDADTVRRTDFSIQLPHVAYTHQHEQIDLTVSAQGQLQGVLPSVHTLTLREMQVHHGAANVIGEGSVSLVPPFQFQVSAAGDVVLDALLPRFFADVPVVRDLQGHVALSVIARGTPLHPMVRVGLDVQGLVLENSYLGDVSTDLVWAPRQLSVEALRINHPDAGIITGSGHVDLTPPFAVTSALRLHGVSLPDVLHVAGVPNAWIRMLLHGDIHARGQLFPLDIEGQIKTHIRQFASLNTGYRDPKAHEVLAFPHAELAGPFHIDAHAATVHNLEISVPPSSSIQVNGQLAFDAHAGMALTVHGDQLDLSDVGPIADLPFAGTGPLTATIVGPYHKLEIEGIVAPNHFSVLGYSIGDLHAPLRFADNILSVSHGTIVRHVGDAVIEGALDFAPTDPKNKPIHTRANLTLNRVGIGGLLSTLQILPDLAKSMDAPVSGEINLDGPITTPVASGSLHADKAVVHGLPLGGLTLTGGANQAGAHPEKLWIRAQATTASPSESQSHLDVFVGFADWHNLTGTVDVQHIDLRQMRAVMGDLPISGMLTAHATFQGEPQALDGTLSAQASQLDVFDLYLGTTALQGEARAGTMEITGTTLDDHAALAIQIALHDQFPYDASAKLTDTALHQLWRQIPQGLQAHVTGQLTAQGKLLRANTAVAVLDIERLDATWNEFSFALLEPAQLGFRNRTLSIGQIALQGPQLNAQIKGTVPLQGAMNVRATAQGDLSMLTKPLHGVESLRGPVELDVRATGLLTAPSLHGHLTAHDVHAHISAIEQSLENGKADIVFGGHTVQVRSIGGTLGGGTADVRGVITLTPGAQPELQLDAVLRSVQARPQPDLTFTMSGELNLSGPMNKLSLTGNTQVDALRYTHDVKLEDWIKNRNTAPLAVPALVSSHNTRLGVHVRAKNNVLISNNVLEAELQLDLMLSGTAERPGLLGNITPLWARARYRDAVFVTKRATLDFVDEYGLTAQFDVQAATQACGMQINVAIHGDSDAYSVVPTGQDSSGLVQAQDVLSCLQFGLRLRDFSGPNAAGMSDALRGSLDALWTVSGLDERVRKLLPIRIDELRLSSRWSTLRKRTTPTVLVSKEVGKQLALKYSRSIDDISEQVLSIEYRVSPQATVQGSWLSATTTPTGDFGLDLRLHWDLR